MAGILRLSLLECELGTLPLTKPAKETIVSGCGLFVEGTPNMHARVLSLEGVVCSFEQQWNVDTMCA